MFKRPRSALVETFVGAVGLGYLLAQCVIHFVGTFTYPIAKWIARNEYRGVLPNGSALPGFVFRDALPEFGEFLLLLLVWYLLFRWLYYPGSNEKHSNVEQTGTPT
jgi:hypothetical protein